MESKMKSANQLMHAMHKVYSNKYNEQHPILNAPGLCNGILNYFYFQTVQGAKNSDYTLQQVRDTSNQIAKTFANLSTDKPDSLLDMLYTICYLQNPDQNQPKGSRYSRHSQYHCDDIPLMFKDLGCEVEVKQTLGLSGTFNPEEMRKVLEDYFKEHPNQLIRIATPTHVIGVAYHPEDQCVSIVDAAHPLDELAQIVPCDNLDALNNTVFEIGKRLYAQGCQSLFGPAFNPFRGFENQNFSISLKVLSTPREKENTASLNATEYRSKHHLMEHNPNLEDTKHINALFVSSMYGHADMVKFLLSQEHIKPMQASFPINKKPMTPIYIAAQKGYPDICADLLSHPKSSIDEAELSRLLKVSKDDSTRKIVKQYGTQCL